MGQMPDQLVQSPGVYGAVLFNENASGFPLDLGFWPEGGGPSASRCGSNDDDRSGQELVCLNHHRVAITVPFVTYALR